MGTTGNGFKQRKILFAEFGSHFTHESKRAFNIGIYFSESLNLYFWKCWDAGRWWLFWYLHSIDCTISSPRDCVLPRMSKTEINIKWTKVPHFIAWLVGCVQYCPPIRGTKDVRTQQKFQTRSDNQHKSQTKRLVHVLGKRASERETHIERVTQVAPPTTNQLFKS